MACIVTANLHSKGVVETKGRPQRKTVMRFIGGLHPLIDSGLVASNLLLEDGGQSGAGVFRINVDATGQHGLLADIGSRQIEAALDFQMSLRFDLLGQKFAEDERLSKILGTDHDAISVRWSTRRERERRRQK